MVVVGRGDMFSCIGLILFLFYSCSFIFVTFVASFVMFTILYSFCLQFDIFYIFNFNFIFVRSAIFVIVVFAFISLLYLPFYIYKFCIPDSVDVLR